MNTEKEMALRNLILKVKVGSHLYGTATPESDEDFAGIFIPDVRYLLGFSRVEDVDCGVKSKDSDGKNTREAVDFQTYTLKKFAALALANNPNILEILFVNDENILALNDVGKELLSLKRHFLSRRLKNRFLDYAYSQKHKMVIKLENYEKLHEALKFLEKFSGKFLLEMNHHPLFVKKKDHMRIADINIPLTATTKKAMQAIRGRLSTFGSRQQLVSKYGFDTKFASHLIRLMTEGIELLSTGNLEFPLAKRGLLKDIRAGKYSMSEVLKIAEDLEKQVERLHESSDVLSSKPNEKLIEKFLIQTHINFINRRG